MLNQANRFYKGPERKVRSNSTNPSRLVNSIIYCNTVCACPGRESNLSLQNGGQPTMLHQQDNSNSQTLKSVLPMLL